MEIKLKVLADYRNRSLAYEKGKTITVDRVEALALLADSPGSFKAATKKDQEALAGDVVTGALAEPAEDLKKDK